MSLGLLWARQLLAWSIRLALPDHYQQNQTVALWTEQPGFCPEGLLPRLILQRGTKGRSFGLALQAKSQVSRLFRLEAGARGRVHLQAVPGGPGQPERSSRSSPGPPSGPGGSGPAMGSVASAAALLLLLGHASASSADFSGQPQP
jgi:hypothetical protein